MVQKRPFDDEELYEVSSKHPRQLEHSHQLVSILEFVPTEDAPRQLQISGEDEDGYTKNKFEGDEKLTSDIIPELPTSSEVDIETSAAGHISISSWAINSTSEENVRSKAPVHVLLSPEYFYPDRPIRALANSEEIYSSLMEYPPRKPVPIGPDHQADIPAWDQQGTKNTLNYSDKSEAVVFYPQASDLDIIVANDDEKRLVGTCVLPMPDLEPPAGNSDKIGNGRTDCSCQDRGSFRCVRQHIMEARERLKRTLGHEIFVELGFCDMGEEVAEKWSEEEEQLFHEVVLSNPARLGKNFWDHLSMVFPFRMKKDIVSYYFNVFMLRRRAEQNRCVPMNIDSDNDEWQDGDDYDDDDEPGMTEDDEDSVAESPVYQDGPGYNQSREDDLHEYHKDVVDEICDNNENLGFGSARDSKNISEKCLGRFLNDCSSDPTFQLPDKTPWNWRGRS
ncbi:hypothetical protein L1049_027818 [Liquidambar formosana]|uniref:Myb-like domain-containing protein n=1 Tax=Liquidambar formosana TaxID=63359 RepID=A0AAP0RIW4_LIQFO